MTIVYISLVALIGLGLFAALFSREKDKIITTTGDCSTCNGTDTKCKQVCMMEAATKEIEYYDDEELDIFRGRSSENYSDEEAELFREVLYTMNPEEIKGWNRSLILRQINVPNQIKDELLMMIEG
ncbi:MAG: hypothetical protein IJV27_09065 [Prevotella sp.]|nr:hypothetical protein [Prevotella sp.]